MIIVTSIIILFGILGGLVNYITTKEDHADDNSSFSRLIGTLISGIGASFLVPLFLNMISSDIIKETRNDAYKFLVLAGFCLVAAFSSRTFIKTLSSKVINEVKSDNRRLRTEIKDCKVRLGFLIDIESEPISIRSDSIENASDNIANFALDCTKKWILKAMGTGIYHLRSMEGIIQAAAIDRDICATKVSELIADGFIKKIVLNDGPRYIVTKTGKNAIHNGQ